MDEQDNIIFREEQKFSPYLTAPIVIATALTVGISGFSMRQLVHEQGVTNPIPIILLIATGVLVPIAVALLFITLKLETEVRTDGFYVRFFPVHLSYKKFPPQDIIQHYQRQYRPILEYGGWGIRYSFKAGKAYNVSGNQGVQLILKNNKRLLIGSKKPDQLAEAVQSLLETSEGPERDEAATGSFVNDAG